MASYVAILLATISEAKKVNQLSTIKFRKVFILKIFQCPIANQNFATIKRASGKFPVWSGRSLTAIREVLSGGLQEK